MIEPRSFLASTAMSLALFASGGCGWVDATGRQPEDVVPADDVSFEPDEPSPPSEPSGVPVPIIDSVSLGLLEKTPRDVTLEGPDRTLGGWRWRALDEPGDVAECASVDGFDVALAERRLSDACSDADDCALEVDERRDGDTTLFSLVLPALRAPVVARVALSTRDADGLPVERRRTLCGLSINEAPEARDDRFLVALGETLGVDAGDADALLANDEDDDDVRNAPLAIDPVPAIAPTHAALFELGTDGSFVYRPADDAPLGSDGVLEDSFTYRLSDGLHEAFAQVVIVIGGANRPPVADGPLPDVEIAIDPLLSRVVRIDLAAPFSDPDGDPLAFAVAAGSLPPGGGLFVDERGVLAGSVGPADLGSWRVTLIVGDGRSSIERDFRLDVVRAFELNAAPTVTDIGNRRVEERFRYDVAPFFDDADGDRLRFSARGLPEDVDMDEEGVITGRSKKKNRGDWFVLVTADDGRGGRVSDGFRLTIE